ASFHVHLSIVSGAAQEAAVELAGEARLGAAGGKREAHPGVPDQRGRQRGADAIVADEPLLDVRRPFGVTDPLEPVGAEQPGIPGAQEGKAEPEASAGLTTAAQVPDGEALARVVDRYGAGDPAGPDGRVGVGKREVVDVGAELPLEHAPLAAAEEVRLFEAEEASDAGTLPPGRAAIDVARTALLDPEGDVPVDAVFGRLAGRRRPRLDRKSTPLNSRHVKTSH